MHSIIINIVKHAFMITSFVFIMMLVIEYLNVLSNGKWQKWICKYQKAQYFISSFLGFTPGCLGAFAVVSLFIHRIVTVGALVAAMIATSGDESFVMLAMFPQKALIIFLTLFGIGLISGYIVDLIPVFRKRKNLNDCKVGLQVHKNYQCDCFPSKKILKQWINCSAYRGLLSFILILFLFGILSGEIGPKVWNWIRVSLLLTSGVGLFIVSTVPDHFLKEHLWNHIVKKHIVRIFLWTLGALLVMHLLTDHLHLEGLIKESRFTLMIVACLLGVIPESGPHLIFVTFYASGMIPFSVLLASSIVQDGHGMLPVLASSRKTFVTVKFINLIVGFIVGLIGYLMNW